MNDIVVDNYINIVLFISTKCNLFCKHCMGNYDASGTNAQMEDLRQIASHFPLKGKYEIEITGGESFCNKDVMYEFLEHIQTLNPPNLRICGVDTNGLWIRDEESVKKVFCELKERGVDVVGFLSNDKYHAEAGLDLQKLFMAKRIAKEYFNDEKFVFIGSKIEKAVPIGRAKTLVPSDEWDWESECYAKKIDFDKNRAELYIEPDGTAHVCQLSILAVKSNILNHSYEEVAEHFQNSTLFQALSGAGPKGIARLLGIKSEDADKKIKKLGECVYCEQLHNEYARTIAEFG